MVVYLREKKSRSLEHKLPNHIKKKKKEKEKKEHKLLCTVFWNRFEPVPIFYPPATISQALERDGQGPRPQFWFSFVTGLLPSFLAINDVYSAQKIKSSFFFC